MAKRKYLSNGRDGTGSSILGFPNQKCKTYKVNMKRIAISVGRTPLEKHHVLSLHIFDWLHGCASQQSCLGFHSGYAKDFTFVRRVGVCSDGCRLWRCWWRVAHVYRHMWKQLCKWWISPHNTNFWQVRVFLWYPLLYTSHQKFHWPHPCVYKNERGTYPIIRSRAIEVHTSDKT